MLSDAHGVPQVIPPYIGVPSDDAPCHKRFLHPNCTKPPFDFRRLGRRMAAFLISPWVPKNAVFQEPKRGPFRSSQFELSSIPATAKELFGLPEFLTKRDAWAAPFTELLTLDSPRQDCPMTLPAPPEGVAAPDSPILLPTAETEAVELPPLQCKGHSTARRPDDGECSRYEPTRRQLKQIELFSRLTSTPMPDVGAMGREDADAWAMHRFAEWRRGDDDEAWLKTDDSSAEHEAVVGDVRVQALSPTLLRVEPRGPRGFENRSTFVVTNRSGFAGLPLTAGAAPGELVTSHFTVTLRSGADATVIQRGTCAAPQGDTAAVDAVHDYAHRDDHGILVQNRSACCAACEASVTCLAWVFSDKPVPVPPPNGKCLGAMKADCGPAQKRGPTACAACILNHTDLFRYHPGSTDRLCPDAELEAFCGQPTGANCWPMLSFASTQPKQGFHLGFNPKARFRRPSFVVSAPSGKVLYDSALDHNPAPNRLHWPAPLTAPSYALVDRPRFYAPPWGATPIPANATVESALRATNGFDFRNIVDGDTYVFLLGETLSDWQASRQEFITLAGPTPLLPDFAHGIWFTRWHPYTEILAKNEIARWNKDELPLDIWALDLDWRNTSGNAEWFYTHPNVSAFPGLPTPKALGPEQQPSEWFEYLSSEKLRTYLSDHPYPCASRNAGGLQTSREEVQFRWQGLSTWMAKGSTFWW